LLPNPLRGCDGHGTLPLPHDSYGFRRAFDGRLLASPSCLYTYAITDGTAVKLGRTAGNPVRRLAIPGQIMRPLKTKEVGIIAGYFLTFT
jgi:hypothetical protein